MAASHTGPSTDSVGRVGGINDTFETVRSVSLTGYYSGALKQLNIVS